MALGGATVGLLHARGEVNPLPIEVRAPRRLRSSVEELSRIKVKGAAAPATGGSAPPPLVSLGEIGHFEEVREDKTIYHKNLERVAYVFAEMADARPLKRFSIFRPTARRTKPPPPRAAPPSRGPARRKPDVSLEWRGRSVDSAAGIPCRVGGRGRMEYHGARFPRSRAGLRRRVHRHLSAAGVSDGLLLHAADPDDLDSAHHDWHHARLLDSEPGGDGAGGRFSESVFFTATAMIGMIALSGIAVRNAILLIEFVHEALKRGQPCARRSFNPARCVSARFFSPPVRRCSPPGRSPSIRSSPASPGR
jgi:hypothetical protein